MKKFISFFLLLALLAALPLTAFAAGSYVIFTDGSSFQVGGTAAVDELATRQSVMSAPGVTSDLYNAALENNLDVMWKCSNGADKFGSPITWTEEDVGKEYICRISFYADSAKTQFVDYIDSSAVTIAGVGGSTLFEIYTIALPDAMVGQPYSAQLKTNEVGPKFMEDRYSQLSEFGLSLSQDGIISGTPTKAGNCHVNIIAQGQGGEATANLDITVAEEEYKPHLELIKEPSKMAYKAGEVFDPTGMEVMIHTFDGSTMLSKDGQYLEYYKEPLTSLGDVKLSLSHGDLTIVLLLTVEGPELKITTESLPAATVGKAYSTTLACNDTAAQFCEYYNPGKANQLKDSGLFITPKGKLEGTPTKAGSFTFTICATAAGGEAYREYTLVVEEAEDASSAPGSKKPNKNNSGKTDKTEKPESTQPESKQDSHKGGGLNISLIIGIGAGILIGAAAAVIAVTVGKKKAR